MALPLLLVLALLGAGSVVLWRTGSTPPAPDAGPLLRRASRRSLGALLAGALLGLVVAVVVAQHGALGRGTALAVPAGMLALLVVVAAAEATVRPAPGPVRSTSLRTRRVRDQLPRALGAAVGGALLLLAALLATTTALGSPDDLGRAGRSLTHVCTDAAGAVVGSASRSPWPGSFYSAPIAAMTVVGLLTAAVALTAITRRPRIGGTVDLEAADDALRRRSGETVVAAGGLLVGVPLGGCTALAGMALLGHGCAPASWTALAVVVLVVAAGAAVLLAWCTGVLLAPGRSRAATVDRDAVRA